MGEDLGGEEGLRASEGKGWRCGSREPWFGATAGEGLGALGAAETGGTGRAALRRAPLLAGSAQVRQNRRQSGRLPGGRGSGREGEEPLAPEQPPPRLRHGRSPAREAPDSQGFASKLLEIPAVSLQWL